MIDYPENITPIGAFQQLYCYNENQNEQSFYYPGMNNEFGSQYQSGFEGSRRADVQYKTDIYNGPTENPFDRNQVHQSSEPTNYWAQNESNFPSYQNNYPNSYFGATMSDRTIGQLDTNRLESRRQDVLPVDSFRDGYQSQPYYQQENPYIGFDRSSDPYNLNAKPQNLMPNGYSYNNPYASALGMEVTGFDRHTSENWSNQYVQERPIQIQGNPWRDTYTSPYDNRYQAFEGSLQARIPNTPNNEDPFASWAGYAENNWPDKK